MHARRHHDEGYAHDRVVEIASPAGLLHAGDPSRSPNRRAIARGALLHQAFQVEQPDVAPRDRAVVLIHALVTEVIVGVGDELVRYQMSAEQVQPDEGRFILGSSSIEVSRDDLRDGPPSALHPFLFFVFGRCVSIA